MRLSDTYLNAIQIGKDCAYNNYNYSNNYIRVEKLHTYIICIT